jgi:hypothetical protein
VVPASLPGPIVVVASKRNYLLTGRRGKRGCA